MPSRVRSTFGGVTARRNGVDFATATFPLAYSTVRMAVYRPSGAVLSPDLSLPSQRDGRGDRRGSAEHLLLARGRIDHRELPRLHPVLQREERGEIDGVLEPVPVRGEPVGARRHVHGRRARVDLDAAELLGRGNARLGGRLHDVAVVAVRHQVAVVILAVPGEIRRRCPSRTSRAPSDPARIAHLPFPQVLGAGSLLDRHGRELAVRRGREQRARRRGDIDLSARGCPRRTAWSRPSGWLPLEYETVSAAVYLPSATPLAVVVDAVPEHVLRRLRPAPL